MVKITKPAGTISLYEAAKLTGYHQDYLGQLCRAGKLKAIKIGRNWYTTEQAVNTYFAHADHTQSLISEISPIEIHTPTKVMVDGLPIAMLEPGDETVPAMTSPIHGGWVVQYHHHDNSGPSVTDLHNRKAFRNNHLGVAVVTAITVVALIVGVSTLVAFSNVFLGNPLKALTTNYDSSQNLFKDKSVAGAVDSPVPNSTDEETPKLKPN